jgi:hypothetical protein
VPELFEASKVHAIAILVLFNKQKYEISGSHSSEYEEHCLLGYCAM